MLQNLLRPWSDSCSPPQTPFLSFHSLGSDDFLFASGGAVEIRCQSGLRSVGLRWSLHRNMIQQSFRHGDAAPVPGNRYVIVVDTEGLHPGFYDLRVTLDTGVAASAADPPNQRPVTGGCTFGWRVDEMALADTRPDDFRDFWDRAKADIEAIPLDARLGPLTRFAGTEIDAYNTQFACLPPDYDPTGHRASTVLSGKFDINGPDGGRVYGWLAKPEGEGPFPAMLVLPGAGFFPRPRPLEHARHGYLALDIQIHGQDVDLDDYPIITGCYSEIQVEPPKQYYFFHVYLRALRALQYLCSRPDVDPSRIVVLGGSQGGRLATVLAALDSRVTACIAAIANSPNHPQLRWVARCNGVAALGDTIPAPDLPLSDGMAATGAPPVIDDAISRCMAYYDPMNFAPDIRCPVLMNGGLIDPVSPPTSVWATYLRLGTASKSITAIPGLGHDWSAEFDRRAWSWLDTVHSDAQAQLTRNGGKPPMKIPADVRFVEVLTPTPWPTPPPGQTPLAGMAHIPLTTGTRLRLSPLPVDGVLAIGSAFDKRQDCRLTLRSPDGTWSYRLDAGYCSIGQRFHIAIPRGVAEILVETHDTDDTLWVLADHDRLPGSVPAVWPRNGEPDLLPRFFAKLEHDSVAEFGWMGGCVLEAFGALESARWQRARASWLANFLDDTGLRYQDPMGREQVNTFISIETTLPLRTIAELHPDHPIVDIALDFLGRRACRDATCEGCYTVAYPLMQIAAARGREDLQVAALAELSHRRSHLYHDGDIYLRHHGGDSRTFRNWTRGVCWYLLGHAECLRLGGTTGIWADAAAHLSERATWAMQHQRPDGLWSNFFYEPELPADTAGSAGIAAALILCHQLGLLGPEARAAAERCWDALPRHLHLDGWLGGTSPSNKRGEETQHLPTRVGETFGMGLMGLLAGRLGRNGDESSSRHGDHDER